MTAETELARALGNTVRGRVRFDAGTRALYSTDASVYRQVPIGVVEPKDADDVRAAVATCREYEAPILPRGSGTSLAGQACNAAVVIDTRLLSDIEIDPDAQTARVGPGVVLDALQAAAAPHGLAFGPDPSTHNRCTLGGMVANNACGLHSVAWGKTVDNVAALDVLLYDGTELSVGPTAPAELERLAADPGRSGEVYRALQQLRDDNLSALRTGFPELPRRVSGYNLDELLPERGTNFARALVGTEGTCALTLSATVRLVDAPPARALLALGYPDIATAADHVPAVLDHRPLGLEGFSDELVRCLPDGGAGHPGLALLPEGAGWLFVEFGGTEPAEAETQAAAALRALRAAGAATSGTIVTQPALQRRLWAVREDGSGLASRLPDGTPAWSGWEDAAVPPLRLGDYLRDFRKLLDAHRLHGIPYGHFGDGCIHVRINFDLADASGARSYRQFLEDAADLVVSYGGSLSGEHGDGQARAELLARMYNPTLMRAFAAFKAVFDPTNRMNPGKIVTPNPLDADLRPALPARALPMRAHFALAADRGSFASAAQRCVGIAKCVRPSGGTMCPSYQVTGQEEHSTRGRARLLFEMMRGDLLPDGWRSTTVRDALDLCLGCKACRHECPVSVDMATYKAEFLAQHYRHRIRPAGHYSMGYLPRWARAAARAPRAANAATGFASRSALLKRVAGIDPRRQLPPFANETFLHWLARQAPRPEGRPVLLWPDTFTNYFTPEVGRAAVRVLHDAGLRVVVPSRAVCCGLTWVSTGQLDKARRVMRRMLRVVAPYVSAGMPIVGLEPSCTAALRTDVPELVDSPDAHALAAATRTFATALADLAPAWTPPTIGGSALVQVHCHQQALLQGYQAETELLARAGVRPSVLDAGCCGLAGNFGFETGHYDVSMACAEQQLLPAVRALDPASPIITDGFSCRTQVSHGANRAARHLAELLADALPGTEPA